MHMVAHNYPVLPGDRPNLTVARKYSRFYKSLGDVLPCRSCREHYRKRISGKTCTKLNMDVFKDRRTLIKWVWLLHNCVNRDLGKPQVDLSTATGLYEGIRTRGRSVSIKILKRRRTKHHKSLTA